MKLFGTLLVFIISQHKTFAAAFTCSSSGIFADPTNCGNFLQCSPGYSTPFVTSCGTGLLFNSVAMVCDWPVNVVCGTRPLPGGQTSAPPPATTTTTVKAPTTSTKATTVTPTIKISSTTPTTTTKAAPVTTPTSSTSSIRSFPSKVLGMYLSISGNADSGFGPSDNWTPSLYSYQQTGANVLFFSFIHPDTMQVPLSFINLAKTRGTGVTGGVPSTTVIIFAIGGQEYSESVNPWPWLMSQSAAESMAATVATWPSLYGCDGVDLDLEAGAGDTKAAGVNLAFFIKKLKQLQPNMIVTQPGNGWPNPPAVVEAINEIGTTLINSVGIMWYSGTESLLYVDNYAKGPTQGNGVTVNVPYANMIVGCQGSADVNTIQTLAAQVQSRGLRGIMVWYASVVNGFQYDPSWDASSASNTAGQAAFIAARNQLVSG